MNNQIERSKLGLQATPSANHTSVRDQFLASDHLSVTDISMGTPLETSDHCEIPCKLKWHKIQIKPFRDRFGIAIKLTGKV